METIQDSECLAPAVVGDSPPAAGLDFKEAMNDFRTMFPTLDSDVIEAVLRSNRGNVDRTVDQLLTISNDCQGGDTRTSCSISCMSSNNEKPSIPQPVRCTTFLDPLVYV